MTQFRRNTKAKTVGTHLVGYITTKYDHLRRLFGEPGVGDEAKSNFEWVVEGSDGTVFTIYDWKMCDRYCQDNYGEPGLTKDEMKDLEEVEFNVGGHSVEKFEEFCQFLERSNALLDSQQFGK